MIEEKEVLMVPPTTSGEPIPTFRVAKFLKPILNLQKDDQQPLPTKPGQYDLPLSPSANEVLTKRVSFWGRIGVQEGWKDWVEKLQPTHQDTWKKVGIFDAIRASTYTIERDDELIFLLAQKWCPETNTFVFPWGETTISLEDVLVLGSFSVLGGCVHNPSQNPQIRKIEKKLAEGCGVQQDWGNLLVTHNQWVTCFKGKGGVLENAALIVLWLSRYVFSTNCNALIYPLVVPIAISLSIGIKVAIAPLVLASIYRDLSLLREKIVTLTPNGGGDNGLNLNLWAPFHLLQLWAWERFPTLSPKPTSLPPGEPRLARWHNVKKPKQKSLGFDMEFDGENFVWRPYTLPLENWVFPKFYPDQEMWVLMDSDVDEELLSWARCIRACELVGMNSVEKYHPHRVGIQFGMDQDMPGFLSSAWSSYDRELDGLKLYLPHRLFEGDVTVEYARRWRECDEAWMVYNHHSEGTSKTPPSSEIVPPQISQNFANVEVAQQCHRTDSEGQKGKELNESHENMPNYNNQLEGITEKLPSVEIISSKSSENLAQEDTQQCQEIRIEGKNKEKKGGEHIKLDLEKNPEESHEYQNELESMKEQPRESEMRSLEYSGMAEDREQGKDDAEEEALNQEKNKFDNVVILDEVEEAEDSYSNRLVARASELEARVRNMELLVPGLKAARQGR